MTTAWLVLFWVENIVLLGVLYRYMTRKCPSCEKNGELWSSDTLRRINEWSALIDVAEEMTGCSHHQIVRRVIKKMEARRS